MGGSASPSRCRSAEQPRDPLPCQPRHVVATETDQLVAGCRTASVRGAVCLLPEPGDRGGNGLLVRCGLEGAERALELGGVKHEWALPLVQHLGGLPGPGIEDPGEPQRQAGGRRDLDGSAERGGDELDERSAGQGVGGGAGARPSIDRNRTEGAWSGCVRSVGSWRRGDRDRYCSALACVGWRRWWERVRW